MTSVSVGSKSDGSTTFTVDGGFGSVAWTLAEIVEASSGLLRIAELLNPVIDRLASERLWLDQASYGTVAYPQGSLDAMSYAQMCCWGAQSGTSALALKAGKAAENYEATEVRNANFAALRARLQAVGGGWQTWLAGPLAPVKAVLDLHDWEEAARRDGLRDTVESTLNDAGAHVAGALGPGVSLIYLLSLLRRSDAGNAGVGSAFTLRKFFDQAGLVRPGSLGVRQVPEQEWNPARGTYTPPGHAQLVDGSPCAVEATLENLLNGSKDAYAYPPGSIAVVRIPRPDATNVWIVHLPGTEDWSTLDSANLFDMEGNLEGMTAAQQKKFTQQQILVQELIKEALKAAGALPGEDVLLTGHSGGGIHAAAAAADPVFLAEVNVKTIVIAGAPAKNAHVEPDITVVDLENEDDIVTATDFGPPLSSKDWVTVTSHRPPVAGGIVEIVENAHSIDNYIDDAAELDHSGDPAVQAAKERIRNLLGVATGGAAAGGAVAGSKWVFQGRDNNKPRTKKAAKQQPVPVPGKDFTPGNR